MTAATIQQKFSYYLNATKSKFTDVVGSHPKAVNYAKKILTFGFFALIAYLLYTKSGDIEWQKVISTVKEIQLSTIVLGVVLAVLCYFAYSCYDLFGRYMFDIDVKPQHVIWVGWISYACNLNLGALVGSIAFRYRLYSKLRIKTGEVAKIIGVSVASNWTGYTLIISTLLISGSLQFPEAWHVNMVYARLVGGLALCLIAGYLYLCLSEKFDTITVMGNEFTLPNIKLALMQLALAIVHWSLMASVIYLFIPPEVSFFQVYSVMLVSCLAGAISHIPGGLGVLEATFVAFLSGYVERPEIIAALFAYRCVFYLIPLVIALPAYGLFEVFVRKLR